MPIFDRKCNHCGKLLEDVVEKWDDPDLPCACDNGQLVRFWKPGCAPTAISDSIPGGVEIRHGICNDDGSPRTYYSKAEMKKEADRKGLFNCTRHVGSQGSDKSKHTTKWF